MPPLEDTSQDPDTELRVPTQSGGDVEAATGLPGWVKALVVVVAAIAIALLLVKVLVGGEHGPGQHMGAAGAGWSATVG